MRRVFFEGGDGVSKWVMERLGLTIAAPHWAIGVTDGLEIRGGVVFNGWNGANVDITIYGPGCLRKTIIRGVFSYAFLGFDAKRITARTLSSNALMRAMLPRFGFEFECDLPGYYAIGDGRQYRLLRDEWSHTKWTRQRPPTQ